MADRTAPQTAPPTAQPSAEQSNGAAADTATANGNRPVLPPMPEPKPARGARKASPKKPANGRTSSVAPPSAPAPSSSAAPADAAPAPAEKAAPAASRSATGKPADTTPGATGEQPARKPVLPPPPAEPAARGSLSQRIAGKSRPAKPKADEAAKEATTRAAKPAQAPPERRAPQGAGDTAPIPVSRRVSGAAPAAAGAAAGAAVVGAASATTAPSRPIVAPTPAARQAKPAKQRPTRQRPQGKQGLPRPSAARRPSRRARLRLTRIDPWSVMKTAFLLAVALGVVTVVAVMTVWSVLGAAGLWTSINDTVQSVLGSDTSTTFDVRDYLGTSRILGFTTLVAIADVILLTALATLAAFLYNMAAALLGGIELTLTEDGN
jgi:Transmembrane domain of unknown function (DUF3566)